MIKILSIRQPYATLIVQGHKPIENRVWSTEYRGPVLIHAGLTMHATPIREIERRGGIPINRRALPLGAIIGCADLVDVVTRSTSRWFDGPYGFVFENAQPVKPMFLSGQLGLYTAPDAVAQHYAKYLKGSV